ncbi:transcription factor-like protein DPB [Canna indica]|uniref:Transcription factor-like protein DPB n=1 Tax=Canna indica TaxID=4628 RepID=A0AAQ3KM07_9LILI|nr:transcription factor-like protein DPB [Canna indica]
MHANQCEDISLVDTVKRIMPKCEDVSNVNNLCMQEDDKYEASVSPAEEKKKTPRIKGWGLRKFSTIVCDKIKEKGRTTYNEVADEIICELSSMEKKDLHFVFDEKNIRRRVYDAFNVLMAINVIAKDKKEIKWVGFPCNETEELAQIKEDKIKLISSIQEKVNYLKELEDKFRDINNLICRNQQENKSASISSEGIPLPFLLVRTNPKATVEIEISEDMRVVNFEFNGTPFSLHDADSILKTMRLTRSVEKAHADHDSESPNLVTEKNGQQLDPFLHHET